MLEILQYQFMQNAILSSILAGVTCSIIGVFVVTMEIPFLGVSMSHSAFAGAIAGLLLGINPLVTGLLFCSLSALLIGPIADKANFNADLATGIIFSVMLGLAFLFLAKISCCKGDSTSVQKLCIAAFADLRHIVSCRQALTLAMSLPPSRRR